MGRFDALTKLEEPTQTPPPSPEVPPPAQNQPQPKPPPPAVTRAKTPSVTKAKKPQLDSPPQTPHMPLDTSLLSTKEKTKYGTYLTDESIQKISIRAIQTNRNDHQIVQEAVNQYFERLEK